MSDVLTQAQAVEILRDISAGTKIFLAGYSATGAPFEGTGILMLADGPEEFLLKVAPGEYQPFFNPGVQYTRIEVRQQSQPAARRVREARAEDRALQAIHLSVPPPARVGPLPPSIPTVATPSAAPPQHSNADVMAAIESLSRALTQTTERLIRLEQAPVASQSLPTNSQVAPQVQPASEAMLIAQMIGQATRGVNRPIWTVCPGLAIPVAAELPWRVFYIPLYVDARYADSARQASWQSDFNAAARMLTPAVAVTGGSASSADDRKTAVAAIEAIQLDLRQSERAFEALVVAAFRTTPGTKSEWYPVFHAANRILSLYATLKHHFIHGAFKVAKSFEAAWSDGTVDFEKAFLSAGKSPENFR